MTTKYVLDTNVFIQAHRQWYRFSFASGFWQVLLSQHKAGTITSIDRVRKEIKKGDTLYEWVDKSAPRSLFPTSKQVAVGNKYKEIISWVMAYAYAYGMTVVSHEVSSQAKSRVKMPDVCKKFGIGYRDTFYMLDDLKVSISAP